MARRRGSKEHPSTGRASAGRQQQRQGERGAQGAAPPSLPVTGAARGTKQRWRPRGCRPALADRYSYRSAGGGGGGVQLPLFPLPRGPAATCPLRCTRAAVHGMFDVIGGFVTSSGWPGRQRREVSVGPSRPIQARARHCQAPPSREAATASPRGESLLLVALQKVTLAQARMTDASAATFV